MLPRKTAKSRAGNDELDEGRWMTAAIVLARARAWCWRSLRGLLVRQAQACRGLQGHRGRHPRRRPAVLGWFGGSKGNDAPPVDLDFRIKGGGDNLLARSAPRRCWSAPSKRAGDRPGHPGRRAGDYARILGVLYDDGYYSSVIDIALDGVEAASVACRWMRPRWSTRSLSPSMPGRSSTIAALISGRWRQATHLPPNYRTARLHALAR